MIDETLSPNLNISSNLMSTNLTGHTTILHTTTPKQTHKEIEGIKCDGKSGTVTEMGPFETHVNPREVFTWLLMNNNKTELNTHHEVLPLPSHDDLISYNDSSSSSSCSSVRTKPISSDSESNYETSQLNSFVTLEEDPFQLIESHDTLSLEFDPDLILKSPSVVTPETLAIPVAESRTKQKCARRGAYKRAKTVQNPRNVPLAPAVPDTAADPSTTNVKCSASRKRGHKGAAFLGKSEKTISELSVTQAGLLRHLESANSALMLQESEDNVTPHTSSDPSLQNLIRKQKLERNRESARECRRRKREHILGVEERCRQLERENMELRSQLHAGKEAMKQEEREKTRVCEELEKMIQRGASEKELAEKINNFKEQYSDYGLGRRSALGYHLHQIERLLLPTQVTKMCIWALRQDDSFWQDEEDETSLPVILARELGLSDEQKHKIQQQRGSISSICENLKSALTLLEDLKKQIESKNSTLDQEMDHLQSILTPTQRAKFIVWVTNNPACMHLLNKLWRTVL